MQRQWQNANGAFLFVMSDFTLAANFLKALGDALGISAKAKDEVGEAVDKLHQDLAMGVQHKSTTSSTDAPVVRKQPGTDVAFKDIGDELDHVWTAMKALQEKLDAATAENTALKQEVVGLKALHQSDTQALTGRVEASEKGLTLAKEAFTKMQEIVQKATPLAEAGKKGIDVTQEADEILNKANGDNAPIVFGWAKGQ